MTGDATTASLLDGATVSIRRLTPDDYDGVVALAADLSEEERYLRFFTAHPTYIGEWALSLTAPTGAVVALGVFESGELVGVGNYTTLPKPGYAEIAVVVAHEQHERGVGTALLLALGSIARGAGLHHFVADILARNHAIREVVRDAGWPATLRRDGPVLTMDVDLDEISDAGADA